MLIDNCVIFTRPDLFLDCKQKLLEDITITDFNEIEIIRKNAIVMFIDSAGDTKILKNKYGNRGVVVSE